MSSSKDDRVTPQNIVQAPMHGVIRIPNVIIIKNLKTPCGPKVFELCLKSKLLIKNKTVSVQKISNFEI